MKRKSNFNSLIPMYSGIIIIFTMLLISCSNDDSNPTTPTYSVPVLTTADVSAITDTTANCGGTITSDGGATVTARGVCWSTSQTPTVSDSITNDGGGAGSFTSKMSGLTPETDYYVRAYATNSGGTGYGAAMLFSTLESPYGTVTDIDGNTYQTIKIGNQWWMAENLKVTHYRNGEAIPNVTDNTDWAILTTGAYCNYDNNTVNIATFGRLYNWYALDDSRQIAPSGWHVPTDEEWKQLEMYLGMSQSDADNTDWRGADEGGKLKEEGTTHWISPNTGATNESGFTALPGGYRYFHGGIFGSMGYTGYWWSSTESSSNTWNRELRYDHSDVRRNAKDKRNGFSMRCIRD
jgi:uncharacterized protein (TIGR02145 family)